MNDTERQQLKEHLRAMIAGRGDGIDLKTEFRWVVEGLKQPGPFFANLPLLLPPDSIFYFEGCTIIPEIAALYESNRAKHAVAVIRDTIFPAPDFYHVANSPELLTQLRNHAANHASEKMFDHIKAYQGESLLFAFHDAFAGPLLISDDIPESAVAGFSERLEVNYKREQNINKRKEGLGHLLSALENPGQFRLARKPWWKRLLGK